MSYLWTVTAGNVSTCALRGDARAGETVSKPDITGIVQGFPKGATLPRIGPHSGWRGRPRSRYPNHHEQDEACPAQVGLWTAGSNPYEFVSRHQPVSTMNLTARIWIFQVRRREGLVVSRSRPGLRSWGMFFIGLVLPTPRSMSNDASRLVR